MADDVSKTVSQSEFALSLGVSKGAVSKWKSSGKLVMVGDRVDAAASRKKLIGLGVIKAPAPAPSDEPDDDIDTAAASGLRALVASGLLLDKADAETVRENYVALKRKLELEVAAGKLVEIEPLRRQLFAMWRAQRDAWQSWPVRVSALMADELGIEEPRVLAALERHVRDHLTELSDKPGSLRVPD